MTFPGPLYGLLNIIGSTDNLGGWNMDDHDEDDIRLTEGTHDPAAVERPLNPVDPDEDPLTVYAPDTGDMPDDLPYESYYGDRSDRDGADDHPEAAA